MVDLTKGHWFDFVLATGILFIAIYFRYLILAGIFYYGVNTKYKAYFEPRKISLRPGKENQIRKELVYSMISSLLFALLGTMVFYSFQKGKTALYTGWHQYPWYWMILSLVLILFIHETYYYWLHRWMHLPKVFALIHRTHHESLSPTAWTSFSFHPIESLLQALPIFGMIYFIPMHIAVLILFLIIMAITSVINHLNNELYPAGTLRHWFGRWWIGATHHAMHHMHFHYNFGLYFTFWDHWMKTESPDYEKTFEEKTR